MNLTVSKTDTPAEMPVLSAPPSKSDAHRLLFLSALSVLPKEVTSVFIRCKDSNADIDATIGCLCALGAEIKRSAEGIFVVPCKRAYDPAQEISMCVGESGSTLRFLIPVLGALGASACIRMEGRLPDRPLAPLDAVLTAHGMTLSRDTADKTLLHVAGQLTPGAYEIDGSVSSQFITGLLFALPLLEKESTLTITGTVASAPYIALTLSALSRFGLELPQNSTIYHLPPCGFHAKESYAVEGDYSGAAFLLCAGAISGRGIRVLGLQKDSVQGDRRILSLLEATGCRITHDAEGVTVLPPENGVLQPFSCNADDIPDLVPPLSILAAAADGVTRITGCARLRIKESDRLTATKELLLSLGGRVQTDDDSITVTGGLPLHSGTCNGCNDHRIVMSAALAALCTQGEVTITDTQAISKSYPGFFEDFINCGVSVRA